MDISTGQQQGEQVKKWLRDNALSIILGLVIGGGGIFGWNYYQSYQDKQNLKAANGFAALTKLNPDEFFVAVKKFAKDNPDSVYAINANLNAAARAVEIKEYAKAREHLRWVMKNSEFNAYKLMARLQLARVNLNTGKAQAAIDLLEGFDGESFNGQYMITLADAYAKIGQSAKARSIYQNAKLLALDNQNLINLIDMKLNNLGG